MAAGALVQTSHKQKGLALLVMIIVLMLVFVTFSLSNLSVNQVKTDKNTQTQAALKKAKEGLIAYVAANWAVTGSYGNLGKLPCPDYVDTTIAEGEQDGSCGNAYANAIGYFPWRTLGLDEPKDGSGNCLIYAVSPAYKTSPAAALNPDSYGQFQIVDDSGAILIGSSAEDRPIAVILAPGDSLSGQVRSVDVDTICGADYDNIVAYLDDDGTTNNAALDTGADNVIDQLVQIYADSASAANPTNDRLITISYDEIWSALQTTLASSDFDDRVQNLTEALALCLAAYGTNNSNHLPMPSLLDLGGGEYRRDVDYDDSNVFISGFAGRLPYDVGNANTELGNSDQDHIFDNGYCDGIDLITTAAAETINFSDDSGSDNGEYFDIWRNWKEHFFYAVSAAHKPDAAIAACAGNCVSVDVLGNNYAGIIFYAGEKQAGQQRYTSLFDASMAADLDDDKDDVINYLEDNRAGLFPDDLGVGVYDSASAGSNDIMFCIKTDMSVEAC